jgi:site-specific DNA-methyltransferase (adenine-specific)
LRSEWEAITVVQKPLVNNYLNTVKLYGVGLLKTQSIDFEGFQSNIIEKIARDPKNDYNNHITIKPLALIEKLVDMAIPKIDGNIVIDPFLGSGTTAVAAINLNIEWIGIEINPKYIEIARKRVDDAIRQSRI